MENDYRNSFYKWEKSKFLKCHSKFSFASQNVFVEFVVHCLQISIDNLLLSCVEDC